MKKCILFFLVTAWSFNAHAQMNKGNLLLGASSNFNIFGSGNNMEYMSIGFSTIKYDDTPDEKDKLISLNLNPKVGYFIIDNLAIGLDLNVGFSNQKSDDGSSTNNALIGVGPFVRYYVGKKKIKPFLEANSLFSTVNSKYDFDSEETEVKSKIKSFGGGVGIAIPMGDKFCFDALLSYSNLTLKEDVRGIDRYGLKINSIGLKLGFTVFLGKNSTN